ncbi:MAG: hypothetical protein M1836_006341 [Candelina mexicana]|nr:MAG: hypothetical protein M1836_006341 [Candelina mexicana]
MSSTSTPQKAASTAPWKASFLEHISKMPSPEFVLSTLHPTSMTVSSSTSSNPAPTEYLPRARYCIYRGMWGELPENKHNEAEQNERVYESEMPTFTSDVRMAKIEEIFATGKGRGGKEECQGSGGGGPVEATWWVKETGTQWRISGKAFVVGEDIEGEDSRTEGYEQGGKESSGVRTVKSEVGGAMRVKEGMEGKVGDWSWQRELTAHFGNNSPGIRASFKAPPPGTPVSAPLPNKDLALGLKVTDLHDPIARANFRVVVIKPEEVEQLEISDPAKARRFKYSYVGGEGMWKTEELWP